MRGHRTKSCLRVSITFKPLLKAFIDIFNIVFVQQINMTAAGSIGGGIIVMAFVFLASNDVVFISGKRDTA
jgi:uncharacterized membrane protein